MLAGEREEQKKKTQSSSKVGGKPSASTKQLTVAESFKGKPAYSPTSERYLMITRQLAIFVGGTNVPNSIVENEAFMSFVKSLDSRYPVPGRALISKEIDKVVITLKQNMLALMSQARKIALCADIWSKKGLTSSYLGVTAHFFSRKDHRKHVVTLCVKRMPSPHTAVHVREKVEEVLHDWELSADKVSLIITDSGSNMVAAFRNLVEKKDDTEEEDDQHEEEDEEGDNYKDELD